MSLAGVQRAMKEESIPGLPTYEDLAEARDALFENRDGISYAEFLEKTSESYEPIDLVEYARTHNFSDAVRIVQAMATMRQDLESKVKDPSQRSNQALIVGCGSGRLLEIYVDTARLLGIESLTFNDLIPRHIDAAREKAKHLYGGRLKDAGVKLQFKAGDFLTADFRQKLQKFDHIISFWYVTSECLNPESVLAIQRHRTELYDRLFRLLVPSGTLFEDIPDPNKTGYYDVATQMTAKVLEEKSLLIGEHKNLLLSNWKHEQTAGFPYQLRYVPRAGMEMEEKRHAGFSYVEASHQNVPHRIGKLQLGVVTEYFSS